MADLFVPNKTVRIKDAGLDESWLQSYICENPGSLGLGDLRLYAKEKVISSGGRLDILLQDVDDEKMYEVEVQLGETDPSHIIRTIEYWDLIRKRFPQRQHFGVLVAEVVTKRFFNVISLLSNSIPIVAVQCKVLSVEGKSTLVFTPVLNAYEEPEDLLTEENLIVDEKYWEGYSKKVLHAAKRLFEETKEVYLGSSLEFNKYSIVIKVNSYNLIKLIRRSGDSVRIEMKHGANRDKMVALLEENNIFPEEKYSQVRFTVSLETLAKKPDLLKALAALNLDWWKAE